MPKSAHLKIYVPGPFKRPWFYAQIDSSFYNITSQWLMECQGPRESVLWHRITYISQGSSGDIGNQGKGGGEGRATLGEPIDYINRTTSATSACFIRNCLPRAALIYPVRMAMYEYSYLTIPTSPSGHIGYQSNECSSQPNPSIRKANKSYYAILWITALVNIPLGKPKCRSSTPESDYMDGDHCCWC